MTSQSIANSIVGRLKAEGGTFPNFLEVFDEATGEKYTIVIEKKIKTFQESVPHTKRYTPQASGSVCGCCGGSGRA